MSIDTFRESLLDVEYFVCFNNAYVLRSRHNSNGTWNHSTGIMLIRGPVNLTN